ncbi:ATPase domain-containing protein [Marinobacter sp. AN1]|uniref:ATPase domain-containing protein n=1 Tax=Marinobacter sp. AN1 TaxID=2886046 RepID=UPI00222E1D13|nr:ATPase domain-containing protein [Marinobacter sp. AN1]UZD64308.1 AAA family ATPase [Marinobacter sp. AN1]
MAERVSTGIPGLDEIMHGGMIAQRTYMVNGDAGSGKTTLSLHFLTQRQDQDTLYITFDKNSSTIEWLADTLGLTSPNLHFVDLSPGDIDDEVEAAFDLLPSSELGIRPVLQRIREAVSEHQPARIVIEPLSSLLYLAPDRYQFRRQCHALFDYLTGTGATVLFTAEAGQIPGDADGDLRFICDGVIELQSMREGRSISVSKFRGSGFADGVHFLRLSPEGMQVFPRLVPEDHSQAFSPDLLSSGIPEMDQILHGGINRGTVTIIAGPTGVGKTTLGMEFVMAAVGRGERSVVYTFEEDAQTMLARCRSIGMPVDRLLERDDLNVTPIEPMRYSPDELALLVRQEVEQRGARTVMLDSSSGYQMSVSRLSVAGDEIIERLHALCRYLTGMGVTVLIINETPMIASENVQPTDPRISHLGDTLILLRYLEFQGEVRKTVGVLKKRTGDFEKSLREFEVTPTGLWVGAPLHHLQGILRGLPWSPRNHKTPTQSLS